MQGTGLRGAGGKSQEVHFWWGERCTEVDCVIERKTNSLNGMCSPCQLLCHSESGQGAQSWEEWGLPRSLSEVELTSEDRSEVALVCSSGPLVVTISGVQMFLQRWEGRFYGSQVCV